MVPGGRLIDQAGEVPANQALAKGKTMPADTVPRKKCQKCGKPILPRKKGARGRGRHAYCSDSCAEAGQKDILARHREQRPSAAPAQRRACAVCGRKFWPSRKTARYCRDECREEGQRRIIAQWKEKRRKDGKPSKRAAS